MIHWVVPEVDAGDVIVQRIVPIQPDDTPETFEVRMHDAEHEIIVEAIGRCFEQALKLSLRAKGIIPNNGLIDPL